MQSTPVGWVERSETHRPRLPGPIPVSPPPAFVEAALMSTGRPVMIVPPKPASVIGSHIGIGWNGSAEAARAVGAAMAYLTTAESVTIFNMPKPGRHGPTA